MKTIKRFFTSWEFFLVILLAVVCAVFYYVDAARVAAGISRRPVFYFANVVRSMRPYFLYRSVLSVQPPNLNSLKVGEIIAKKKGV